MCSWPLFHLVILFWEQRYQRYDCNGQQQCTFLCCYSSFGNSFQKIKIFCRFLGLAYVSRSTFYRYVLPSASLETMAIHRKVTYQLCLMSLYFDLPCSFPAVYPTIAYCQFYPLFLCSYLPNLSFVEMCSAIDIMVRALISLSKVCF